MAALRKSVVLVTEGSEPIPLTWLKEQVEVLESPPDAPDFGQKLWQAEGLVIRTYTKVTEEFLAKAPRLRVVGRGGVGLENIDVAACRRRGVEVVYTPDANTLAVGDYVIGYILQMLRPWNFFGAQAYTPQEFKKVRGAVRGKQLNELTLGIVGMGRVGRRVGHIAALGFGMRVIYNDLLNVHEYLDFYAQAVDKEHLFTQADIVSLHVDMRRGNENLVGAPLIGLMKPSAILINTSRGEVLDINVLAAAVKNKMIAGAALDVYWPEPPAPDFPMLGLENVLLTPHLAARTQTALDNMSWVVKDVVDVLGGKPPRYPAPRYL